MNIETDTGYLDGIELQMVDISDHFEKSIIRYEYPYLDGADLEDMGEKARTVRTRCYFYDNAGQSTYNDHITLLNHLKDKADLEFLHPKYGILKGKVESLDVRHDERKRCAEVDFSFVERAIRNIEASTTVAVAAQVEASFSQSLDEQVFEIILDLNGSGLDLYGSLDPGRALLAQLSGISARARAFARQIDAALGRLSAFATDITQPVNSLIATTNYATSIPGRILGTVDRCVERVARLYDGISNFPSRFQASVDFGLLKLQSDLDSFLPEDSTGVKTIMLKHLAIASSRRLALETAYLYSADQQARRLQQVQGGLQSFDSQGRYTPRELPDLEPMNAIELEDTLSASRSRLQDSVDAARSMQSLKEMALELLASVSAVKTSAEQIITVQVDAPAPLHIICLRYGLPYSDAERIMALNPGLRNPTFVSGNIQIYSGGAA